MQERACPIGQGDAQAIAAQGGRAGTNNKGRGISRGVRRGRGLYRGKNQFML